MKRTKPLLWLSVSGALLFFLTGPAQARESVEEDGAEVPISMAVVAAKFSYQGMLRESGTPVTGTRDMVFHLFANATCTTGIGGDISMPGTEINEGVFSVELSVNSSYFAGEGVWLGVQVEGVTVACQEILPVPYAFSLRPGARVEGEQTNWDAIHAVNTATSSASYGIYSRSDSPLGRGIYGYHSSDSGSGTGVYGRSNSVDGAGVYARGYDEGADLILAGNANTLLGDDGRITSDPAYSSSDIHIITNDGVRVDLDQDNDGEDADFEIRNGDNTLIFNVDESGAVSYGGTGVAAFPRPAYNSGWIALVPGADSDLSHGLGGNIDNYVIDLTCKRDGGSGVNNWGVGGDANTPEYYGAWWSNLSTSQISIHRWDNDTDCPQVRVRIWLYP